MDCSMPGIPVLHYLPEFAQTHVHWVGDAIQPSHPLSSPILLPSIRVFYTESTLHIRWLKYWSFSFSISPSSEYSGLISLRIGKLVWFDFLIVQGTLKSLLQNYSLKASILQHSAFIMVQLSYLYMITGKWLSGRWVWGKKWFYSWANKGSPVSWEQWMTIKSQNEAICSRHSDCLHGGLVQTSCQILCIIISFLF